LSAAATVGEIHGKENSNADHQGSSINASVCGQRKGKSGELLLEANDGPPDLILFLLFLGLESLFHHREYAVCFLCGRFRDL
jgi:hypothetical protein